MLDCDLNKIHQIHQNLTSEATSESRPLRKSDGWYQMIGLPLSPFGQLGDSCEKSSANDNLQSLLQQIVKASFQIFSPFSL